MKLKPKFGFLAALYMGLLLCNVGLCAWGILAYYDLLLAAFGTAPVAFEAAGDLGAAGLRPAQPQPPPGPGAFPPGSGKDGGDAVRLDRRMAWILATNALLGLALGALGVHLVRRWVAAPIAELRRVTRHIARGDWSARIRLDAADEFGDLARDVNRMAAALLTLQSELSQRERQGAAAGALRCVMHNIRSPLTGIRWLAEVVSPRLAGDPEAADRETRIIAVVDRVLRGLNESRASDDRPVRAWDLGAAAPTESAPIAAANRDPADPGVSDG